MTLNDLQKRYKILEKEINQQKFSRDNLVELIDAKKAKLESDIVEKNNLHKASIFFKSKAQNTREEYIKNISYNVTLLIQKIYGSDYEFEFKYNEKALEKGERVGFNLSATITNTVKGNRVSTSSTDSRGGGLLETISVFLRWVFIRLSGYNGPLILDEAWSAVSADDKMQHLIQNLKQYIEITDSQVFLVTHRAELFGKIADTIYLVYKEDGVAQSVLATYDEILEKQMRLLTENED